ncbi:SusC/RagA family TonB-linked outer membrane protein [Mesonia mobilis]|uniref:SusC/RagA family TonB-linked outer membrane protein n=1 Tax=Mesonia mobilis TaxID=369791 RepID=UPI0026EBA146|nr:TonB-dependent receptor [Mesonia mobilis]
MNKNLLLILMFLAPFVSIAQTFSVSGTVVEAETEMPMPGVNVLVKNSTKGVVTDFDGNYTLDNLEEGDIIIFSYIGFETQEVPFTNQSTINISLQPDSQALDEIVLVGYGQQVKKQVTGSVSTVGDETIDNLEPTNAAQALQGTTSGVNVAMNGGAPGSNANIRIRGVSTNGQSKPLIILDGFQYEGGLNSINPADIESFTVLKDAQAAIYGTIGANGVILITTKKGRKNQKVRVEYEGYTGIQQTTRKLPLLNAKEYALYLNEAYANAGQDVPFTNVNDLGTETDWQDEVFDQAMMRSHNLSFRGGEENVSYSLSASNLYQEGIVSPSKSNFERSTAKLSLDVDLSEKINVSTKLFYSSVDVKDINSFALGSVLFNANNIAPIIDPSQDNLDGTIDLGNEVVNPLTQTRNTYNSSLIDRLSGTVQASIDYAKNLNLQGRIGFNSTNTRHRDFTPEFNYGAGKIYTTPTSSVTLGKINDYDYTFDLFNTYENTFGENHDVTFLLGTTVYQNKSEGLYGSRNDVNANSWDFADLSSATGVGEDQTNSSYSYIVRRLSYFGRLQYSFKDKFLFSAMLRRDASTQFGPSNRVGYFPSVTAGYVLSEEDFFDSDFFNLFKVRGSYGVLGNDQFGSFQYLALLNGEATYVLGPDQSLVNGNALGVLANQDLQWEEAKKLDVGVDIEFLENKFSIVADYFHNRRDNLLIPDIGVSGIYGTGAPGAGSPTINAGEVVNKGWEFALNFNEKVSEDFSLSANYNISFLDNEVTEVQNGLGYLEGGGFGVGQPAPSRMEVGFPMGYFYGYQTNGIFQTQEEVNAHPSQEALGAEAQPGDIRFVDINGDGVIDENDRTNLGDPIPEVTMGFNLQVNYKNFDLSAYSFASLGQEIVRNYERNQPNVNRMRYRLDRWTGPGTSNSVPRATVASTSNNAFSDFFVEDGSFLRIQAVTLGYTIPKEVTEKIYLDKFRVYGKVDNIYTFTKYMGYDPTASTGAPIGQGIDYGFYPLPRTFSIGVNLQF